MEPTKDFSRRQNDFPEFQVGYPERNDVRNPNLEMERLHVDFDNFQLSRTNAEALTREIKGDFSK
jgi:hypothetical protein